MLNFLKEYYKMRIQVQLLQQQQVQLQILEPEPEEVEKVELSPGLTLIMGGITIRCRRQVRTISAGGKAFGVAPPRANTKAIRWPLQYHNPLYMAAVDGHSVRQQHVGRHLCGRGGVEGHGSGPEAEKWAVGILFYILTRRLPALTL